MIEIKNLSKSYRTKGEKTEALQNVSINLGNTGFIVLTGKSGSGKSTLLNIIGGLDSFDDGEIMINGHSTKDFSPGNWDSYRNTYVGIVFQEFYIIDEFSVGKNIALALELQGVPNEEIPRRVREILNQVDMADYEYRMPNEISGGQKQRIAIARALVKNPEIILADEPTGNLDTETGRIILQTLKKLSETKLVVMVTHDADFAREYGDRIIELKDGIIINDYLNGKDLEITPFMGNDQVMAVVKLSKNRELSPNTVNYINRLLLASREDVYLTIDDENDNDVEILDNEQVKVSSAVINDAGKKALELKKSALPLGAALKLALNSIFKKKRRLILTSFLFVCSLIFVGIAANFSFLNIPTVTYLTYKNAGIKEIEISQGVCTRNYCRSDSSVSAAEKTNLVNEFPDLRFIDNYDRNISFFSFFSKELNTSQPTQYYSDSIDKLSVLSSLDGFTLSAGTMPGNDQVAITDYLADMFIAYRAFDVSKPADLINQTFSYNGKIISISGIVATDYHKYDWEKGNKMLISMDSGFQSDLKNSYARLFMNDATFTNDFQSLNASFPLILINQNNAAVFYYGTTAVTGTSFQNELSAGRLPQNDDEIAISQDVLDIYLGSKNTAGNPEDILGKQINIIFSNFYDGSNKGMREYTVVGVIEDRMNALIVTPNAFNDIDCISEGGSYNLSVLLLAGKAETTAFFATLHQKQMVQNTVYFDLFSTLYESKTMFSLALYIIGGIFAAFASLLIFTFITTSIKLKQKEIGTLRAIGARGIDVSKIFISEGLILALTSGIIANIGIYLANGLLNKSITKSFNTHLTLLYMSAVNIFIVLGLALFMVTLASYIPIKRMTMMKPIKAIKNLK